MAMTTADCVRAAIPGADDDLCNHIIWGRTAYPFAKLTARDFYKAASGWRRACANRIQLCDFCHCQAVDGWTCKSCNDALKAT